MTGRLYSLRFETKFLPSVKEDTMDLDNPKNFFQCKKKIVMFAEGLDCQVKFEDSDKKSKLVIFSNVYQLEKDKRPANKVEQDRFFNVQLVKEKALEFMKESTLNNSESFMKILDEETRAQCKN